ncbi:hypothetical protein [Pantoea phage Nufs112]|nr:hypothetical protein [Pantoea phage Nufs112]
MPDFNKPYTYGTGRFTYELEFKDGAIRIVNHQGCSVLSETAVRYHLMVADTEPSFRYI